jgi:hypothetical protein
LAKKTPAQLVKDRLALAAEQAAKGNHAAAAAYAQAAANIKGSGQAKVQQVAQQYADIAAPPFTLTTKPAIDPGWGNPQGGGGGMSEAEKAQKALADAQLAQLNAAKDAKLNQDLSSVKSFFNQYGMDKLWAGAEQYIRQGYSDPDTIMSMLSQNADYQQAYYERFPATKAIRELNKQRLANGLPPKAELLPAAYVQMEDSYRKALVGLPAGSYGTVNDVTNWIVNDISPVELADRVLQAKNYINYQANGSIKQQLRSIYGMTDAEMVSYVLDPQRALAEIETGYQRRLAQATVGGAAIDAGLNISDTTRDQISENASFGSSYGNTLAQMQSVKVEDDMYSRLGRLSGVKTSTDELVDEQFGLKGSAEITKKKKNLASQERARFSGGSGITKTSLSAGRLAQ